MDIIFFNSFNYQRHQFHASNSSNHHIGMARWNNKAMVMMIMILLILMSSMVSNNRVIEAKKIRNNNNNNNNNNTRFARHSIKSRALSIINTSSSSSASSGSNSEPYCLSWRMAVEANNMRGWRTIPSTCLYHVQGYMVRGQYYRDISLVIDEAYAYLDGFSRPVGDALDAWILDVDDTCLSNLFYYRVKRFGRDPYNPMEFNRWALRGESPAIPAVLELFNKLVEIGYKVILLTGRDKETLGDATIGNLVMQGFVGFERLIMRSVEYRGQSAIKYKSDIRRRLVEEGYRIWGNLGDQWSDLQGNFTGDRTFKLPNPMYFVP